MSKKDEEFFDLEDDDDELLGLDLPDSDPDPETEALYKAVAKFAKGLKQVDRDHGMMVEVLMVLFQHYESTPEEISEIWWAACCEWDL